MTWILFVLLVILIILALVWWLTYKALFRPMRKMEEYNDQEYEDIYLEIEGNPEKCYSRKPDDGKQYINCWYFNNNGLTVNDPPTTYSGRSGYTTSPLQYESSSSPVCQVNTYDGESDYFKWDDDSKRKTVLFFHGNSGNISHRDYVINICRYYSMNLLLVDYRGYGNSDGIPKPRGIYKDSLLAYDHLRTRCNPDNIIIWGESLGGSAATYVASHRRCRCLLLVSTFSSLDDAIFESKLSGWFKYPVGHLVKWTVEPVPSHQWISKVTCPVVVIHSKDDNLIPYSNAKKMYRSVAHDSKMLVTIKGDHSAPIISEKQLRTVFKFADIDTRLCTPNRTHQLLDDVFTVAKRKGLAE